MHRPTLVFEYSPLFLIVCLLVGFVYAFLLYKKSGPWGKNTNRILFALRFIVATLLGVLLVSPILKQINNTIEQPTFVVAFDNSSSIANTTDSLDRNEMINQINSLIKDKSESGFDVEVRTISSEKSDKLNTNLSFNQESSDLASFLDQIAIDYEGRNLAKVLLVSDGIYNQGISPTFKNYNFPIHSIGIGDTISKSDISITSLVYNKISYQGNKFPLITQFVQTGFDNKNATVSVHKNGKLLSTKNIQLKGNNQLHEVKFLIEASDKGFQRYQLTIQPLDGEFTTLNNSKQAYIEVIEGKENIAIIASAPHPDIKALRYAIESNANYTFDQYIMSLSTDRNRLNQTNKKYDLVIYHQLPDNNNISDNLLIKLSEIPMLTVYGGNTNTRKFNQHNGVMSINASREEYDKVTAAFNQEFINFKLTEDLQQTFPELPPIVVPFGRTSLSQGSKVMLQQQVGSIVTSKPLIAINDEVKPKKAVILGDGLWQWRLASYLTNGNHNSFNELITKLVQFLSSKEDRRKFKAYPIKNEFNTNESIVFDTEVYNDLYERVYGNKINFTLKDASDKSFNYTFITNENNTRYTINGLEEGVYQYTSSTILGDKKISVSGEFVIRSLQVEAINLTADFDLLRKLSKNTGGNFYKFRDLSLLKTKIAKEKAQGVIHSSEQFLPFINLFWIFLLLVILISTEWFLRKYKGSY